MPVKGLDKHLRRLRAISGAEVIRVAGAVVYEGADIIRAEAFRSISAGSVSGAGHVPSAAGESPNRDTGALQAGFKVVQTGPLSAEFRAETPYSAPLEFGSSRVAARPFARPARDKKRREIEERMASQINRLNRRSG